MRVYDDCMTRAAASETIGAPQGSITFRDKRTMTKQISRLSIHQNAKVFGILTAVSSLIFVVPIGLIAMAVGSATGQAHVPAWTFIIFPIIYLIIGYIMTAIGCFLYNLLYGAIGGIEYEETDAAV